MKITILILILLVSFGAFSQEKQATGKNRLETELTFSLNSNGIAPIPAFSLDKPALITTANISLGRFSYSPALAYSLELKPWFIDNWFYYRWIIRPKFELKTGANYSTFLSEYKLPNEKILKGERYFAFALTGKYLFSQVSSLSMDYWSDNGQEKGSLRGHFFDLVYNRSGIRISESLSLESNFMLFYINYDGNNDGLFFSPTISLMPDQVPLSFYFQGNQVIDTNIADLPGFKWNVGVSYTFD